MLRVGGGGLQTGSDRGGDHYVHPSGADGIGARPAAPVSGDDDSVLGEVVIHVDRLSEGRSIGKRSGGLLHEVWVALVVVSVPGRLVLVGLRIERFACLYRFRGFDCAGDGLWP